MFTLTPHHVLVDRNKFWEQQEEEGKDKLKISGDHHIKMLLESMEQQLNSSENFPRIYNVDFSSTDSERHGGEKHPIREIRGPDHLLVNVQRHSVENR